MLLSQEVLEPSVLHLELCNSSFEAGVLLGRFSNGALQGLLALFLLHAESSACCSIAASAVLLCGPARVLFLAEGGCDVVTRDLGAVLVVPDLAVGG